MKRHIIARLNVVRIICDGVLGKEHTHRHRMTVGTVVMGVGVVVAHVHFPVTVLNYVTDGVGYMIHGLGVVPFVDYLIEHTNGPEDAKEIERVYYDDTH